MPWYIRLVNLFKFKWGLFSLTLLAFNSSCYEVLDIKTKNEHFIVVDAWITDENKEHTIRIASTGDKPYNTPVTDALVFIEDKDGSRYDFDKGLSQGNYIFNGQFNKGKEFRLVVIVNKVAYESTWESFAGNPEIGELIITNSRKSIQTYTNGYRETDMLDFSIEVIPEQSNVFLLWKKRGIYEYHSLPVGEGFIQVCWFDDKDNSFFRMAGSSGKQSFVSPLYNVEANNKYKRYNLILEQYGIDQSSYFYWKGIENQRATEGSLFDPPPAEIKGNISKMNNSDDLALGNFTLATYREKRFVFGAREIPIELPMNSCEELDYLILNGLTDIEAVDESCYNCLLGGGAAEAPEGWIDPNL